MRHATPSNRPLAIDYLVLHETSVDYLGESDLFYGACSTSEPAAAAIDSHEANRIQIEAKSIQS